MKLESEVTLNQAYVELRSTNGQLIESYKMTDYYIEISPNTSTGIYLLSIFIDGKVSTKKLVVY